MAINKKEQGAGIKIDVYRFIILNHDKPNNSIHELNVFEFYLLLEGEIHKIALSSSPFSPSPCRIFYLIWDFKEEFFCLPLFWYMTSRIFIAGNCFIFLFFWRIYFYRVVLGSQQNFRGKHRDFPYSPCLPMCTVSWSSTPVLHQKGTFITNDELIHHYHWVHYLP